MIGFLGGIYLFGLLSYTNFGLYRRSLEISGKSNPAIFLLVKEVKELKELLKDEKGGN